MVLKVDSWLRCLEIEIQKSFTQLKCEGNPDFPQADRIHSAATPGSAKKLGGQRKGPCKLRPDWEQVKVDLMKDILLAKFEQNEDLKRILLGTGERLLREHTPRDKFWGDGGQKGNGKNMLGKLLMTVREELRGAEEEREVKIDADK